MSAATHFSWDEVGGKSGELKPFAVNLLDADPELGEGLADADRLRLGRLLRVPVLAFGIGPWEPPCLDPGSIGLLVTSGLITRRATLGPVCASELLGPGDILRPSEQGLPEALSHASGWRVLAKAEVVWIDRRATALLGHFPELSAAIAARLVRRARCLTYLMAAQHFRRIDDALFATLWHIAAMWGKVTLDGFVVPFHFTHEMLAGIIGARRPTVTIAIHALEAQGRLRRERSDRWVLLGEPPTWGPEDAARPAGANGDPGSATSAGAESLGDQRRRLRGL